MFVYQSSTCKTKKKHLKHWSAFTLEYLQCDLGIYEIKIIIDSIIRGLACPLFAASNSGGVHLSQNLSWFCDINKGGWYTCLGECCSQEYLKVKPGKIE